MGKWINNTVPPRKPKRCSDEVLVTVRDGKNLRVCKAVYIPHHHCTVEDMCWNMWDGIPDDWEYYEKEDTWWIPQGFYETADYFEEYQYSAITGTVIAWMKLPKPFEEKMTDFSKYEKDC